MTADDITRFEEYLRHQMRIPTQRVPYYIKWIKEFLRFRAACDPEIPSEDVRTRFRVDLAKAKPDWQVIQADNAVAAFLRVSESRSPRPPATGLDSWDDAESELIQQLRLRNRSHETEKTCVHWFREFHTFSDPTTPSLLDDGTVRAFLTYLAIDRRVSAATQRQAFNAILFLYRHVLNKEIASLDNSVHARVKRRLPVVLSRSEIDRVFDAISPSYLLPARITYGAGLRLTECLSLRMKDIDIERVIITVRSGKGDKDRTTLFPTSLVQPVRDQIASVRELYDEDRRLDRPGVPIPNALARKYPSGTALQRISSRRGTISVPFRSCWVTPTSARQ